MSRQPIHVEHTSNRWSGNALLIAHVWRPEVSETLSADLTTGIVRWRFGRGDVARCTSPEATEAAFRLMLVGENR